MRDLTALLHPGDNEFRKSTQQADKIILILSAECKWSLLCFLLHFKDATKLQFPGSKVKS